MLYLQSNGFFEIHYTILAALLAFISCVIYLSISLLTEAPPHEKLDKITWKYRERSKELEGMKWYQNYRILSVVLLILTAILVINFW